MSFLFPLFGGKKEKWHDVMRHRSLPILLLAVWSFLAFSPAGGRVRFVCDGDTVILESGDRVRYLGIDAPETAHDGRRAEWMAGEARAFNARAVRGQRLRLEFDREARDRYGRLLSHVYLPDGRLLNLLLVREGLARVVTRRPNLCHRKELLQAQRSAMKECLGIWSREPDSGKGPYVGSRRSFRFHRPGCPYAFASIRKTGSDSIHSARPTGRGTAPAVTAFPKPVPPAPERGCRGVRGEQGDVG